MCVILNSITRYFFVIFNFKTNLLESLRRPTVIITFYHFHFPMNLLFFLFSAPPIPIAPLPFGSFCFCFSFTLFSFLLYRFCILHFTVFPFFLFYCFHPDLITNVDWQYSFLTFSYGNFQTYKS